MVNGIVFSVVLNDDRILELFFNEVVNLVIGLLRFFRLVVIFKLLLIDLILLMNLLIFFKINVLVSIFLKVWMVGLLFDNDFKLLVRLLIDFDVFLLWFDICLRGLIINLSIEIILLIVVFIILNVIVRLFLIILLNFLILLVFLVS